MVVVVDDECVVPWCRRHLGVIVNDVCAFFPNNELLTTCENKKMEIMCFCRLPLPAEADFAACVAGGPVVPESAG